MRVKIKILLFGEKNAAFFAFFNVLFEKNTLFFAIFYVLCKRMLHSLRSFTFFAKEHCILCVLLRSKEKNAKECIILLGFISCKKLEKRMQKHVVCSKERKRAMRSECKRTRCPTLTIYTFYFSVKVDFHEISIFSRTRKFKCFVS